MPSDPPRVLSLICLDPGARMGLAAFERDRFVGGYLIRDWAPMAIALHCETLVIECPEIRIRGGGKGDPNQIVDLAYRAGLWAARNLRYDVLCTVKPSQWKASVPKEIMTRRIRDHYREDEVKYPADHNIVDAIGLGLWHTGRLGKGGT